MSFWRAKDNSPKACEEAVENKALSEFEKCREDIVYFANEYVMIPDPQAGLIPVTLNEYQEKLLKEFAGSGKVVSLASRQKGKSTAGLLAVLHSLVFDRDQNIGVRPLASNFGADLITYIFDMLTALPFNFQPTIISYSNKEIVFDNGNKILILTNNIRGYSLNFLYADEPAFDMNFSDFWHNIAPCLMDAKVLMSSTPASLTGLFENICHIAKTGNSQFRYVGQ